MQRVVRDTATQLNKEVEFTSSGDEIELDKTVIELLNDPLTHLIRNSVDHGIETAEKRTSANKNPRGVVSLSAYQMGGHVVIEIRDDGAGLDPERLIRKAVEKNLLKSEERLSKEEAYKLVFLPGFSTKEKVTDVSGRGVGMDVVKTNVSELQGNIEIESELGAGTCFKIVLPLTLAIAEGMVVTVDQDRYVVPITQVQESLRLKGEEVSLINERAEVLNLRGSTLPLYRLSSLLHRPSTRGQASNEGIALVCEGSSGFRFAVLVNDIICQQQVVIKSLGDEIRGFPGISGAAILGDGKASLILDLYEMTSEIRNKRKTKETEAS